MAKSDKAVNVVPMPSFTDPNRPEAANGTINRQLQDSVVEHDPSYGQAYGALSYSDDPAFAPVGVAGDRDEWTKEQWKELARQYDLPVSGNLDELRERVEGFESDKSNTEGVS